MVLLKKKIKNVFTNQLKIACVIFVLAVVFYDYIKSTISPPVMNFVGNHLDFLKILILFIFLGSAAVLIFIVWLLEWGDKQQKSKVTKYISQMVCENYYGNYRRTDVYKAIRTCLSKFSRNDAQEGDAQADARSGAVVRYVDPQVFALRSFQQGPAGTPAVVDIADGVHRTYSPNGKLEQEATYKNNELDGPYKLYYPDGTIHQEKHFKNGKMDGIFKAYDEFGIPYFEITYRDGMQDGSTKIFYKNGVMQYRDTYKDGKRIHRETYSESGELKFSQREDLV